MIINAKVRIIKDMDISIEVDGEGDYSSQIKQEALDKSCISDAIVEIIEVTQ
jgi:hypothetical protein